MRWLILLILTATLARAEGEPAGEFDYYVLSLSWSPTWCAQEGAARGSPQCDADADFGWVLHGLWPQYERGWPSHCRTVHEDPSRVVTGAMADIMGSSGLAWYQWKRHGRCSGLSAPAYFEAARQAFDAVNRPAVFRKLKDPVRLPAAIVEEAFLRANPDWRPDMLTITCKAGRIQEARLCLTRELRPRKCGADVVRDCAMRDALMDPIP
ncbi:ribonuclease T2 family protein [Rhodovulum adriaticum]|uniref:Ribonuclease T2 n=1 Tax=Rhodovulum adriaticum TaxID=35804 RepID=A0A4R2P0N4_RHOAD|nr:ribonuclease T2 [Rhodovulum adriaticum]MBK1634993.1 ribonuclease T [Rhodovulum adriaticum]TCP27464.1 ribonuclease T2 [Rhodovulum adriaticum]